MSDFVCVDPHHQCDETKTNSDFKSDSRRSVGKTLSNISENHVLLYGYMDRNKCDSILLTLSKSRSGNDVTSSREEHRNVDVRRKKVMAVSDSFAKKREGTRQSQVNNKKVGGSTNSGGIITILFRKIGRAMWIDVDRNKSALPGLPCFLAHVCSATDVTYQFNVRYEDKKQDDYGDGGGRRMIVIQNAHHLTPSCQAALRSVIEKASSTSWFVFAADTLTSIDHALLSRFTCRNINFVSNDGDVVDFPIPGNRENGDNIGENAMVDKFLARLFKCTNLAQIRTLSAISKTDLITRKQDDDPKLGPFFCSLIHALSRMTLDSACPADVGHRDDILTPLEKRKKRGGGKRGKGGVMAPHFHASDLVTLIRRLCAIEHEHTSTKSLIVSSGEDATIGDEQQNDPLAAISNETSSSSSTMALLRQRLAYHTSTFVACAGIEIKSRVCSGGACCG